jgi:hypothetical protein
LNLHFHFIQSMFFYENSFFIKKNPR